MIQNLQNSLVKFICFTDILVDVKQERILMLIWKFTDLQIIVLKKHEESKNWNDKWNKLKFLL